MTSSDSGECRTNVFRQNLQIAEPLDTGDDTKEKTTTANATESNEKHNWIKRILKQNGPWNPTEDPLSYKGAPSIPMPVEVSDPESLAPFFAHLRNNGTHQVSNPAAADLKGESGAEPYYNVDYIEFEKGVLYSDGRIDLCKMVTGPRNIGDLMESLKTNSHSKHFLLGNNIIGPTGVEAIASFIEEHPNRIETWYLGANRIIATTFPRLATAMLTSPIITNIWLKRNPLGPSSAPHLFNLITKCPNLRTLDLDQTELGDEGIATLFSLLVSHNQPLPLRNIYLNATGTGPLAAAQISAYLALPSCALESLFLSNNPLGPSAALLAPGLSSTKTLQRLSLQSCGLGDEPVATLLSALQTNPNSPIRALDFGQSYATEDLGMRYNSLTTAAPFAEFISASTSMRYLNISHNPLSQSSVNTLLTAVSNSSSMQYLDRAARPLVRGQQDHASVKAGQESARLTKLVRAKLRDNVEREYGVGTYEEWEKGEKRFLMSPRDVRFIDSVYRNREAGVAKREGERLRKVWEEEGEGVGMMVGGEGEGVKVRV